MPRVLNSPLLCCFCSRLHIAFFELRSRRVSHRRDLLPAVIIMLLSPRGRPSFSWSWCSFGLGRKAGPGARLETLRLCSRALAIKRRPITIVIVVVIAVVISRRANERASAENFTGSPARQQRVNRTRRVLFVSFRYSDAKIVMKFCKHL